MLKDVASVAKPETILGWYRRLVAKKFDGSKKRRSPGRPRIDTEIEKLILEIVDKNSDRGYDKVAGALANLGYDVSDQTVGNMLKRHGISPAPKRKGGIGWKEFIKAQAAVTAACDFFTVEVLTLRGLLTYYVLFFIHLDESRRVQVAGVTRHPDQYWMEQVARNVTMEEIGQVARNVTMEEIGFLNGYKKLLQDRDPKFCPEFRRLIESHGIDNVRLPARSPNLNAVAERWVRTVKSEGLSKLILLGNRRCVGRWPNSSPIIMRSAITRGKTTSYCFPLRPTQRQPGRTNSLQGAARRAAEALVPKGRLTSADLLRDSNGNRASTACLLCVS